MNNKFVTLVTCMDGRIQLPGNQYMQDKYKAAYIDTITEAGPCKIIAKSNNYDVLENIKSRINISIDNHKSKAIGVVGHFDCSGVLESDNAQKQYVRSAAKTIRAWYPEVEVIALWADESFEIEEI